MNLKNCFSASKAKCEPILLEFIVSCFPGWGWAAAEPLPSPAVQRALGSLEGPSVNGVPQLRPHHSPNPLGFFTHNWLGMESGGWSVWV